MTRWVPSGIAAMPGSFMRRLNLLIDVPGAAVTKGLAANADLAAVNWPLALP